MNCKEALSNKVVWIRTPSVTKSAVLLTIMHTVHAITELFIFPSRGFTSFHCRFPHGDIRIDYLAAQTTHALKPISYINSQQFLNVVILCRVIRFA